MRITEICEMETVSVGSRCSGPGWAQGEYATKQEDGTWLATNGQITSFNANDWLLGEADTVEDVQKQPVINAGFSRIWVVFANLRRE